MLARDWLHQPDAVIERIERALRGELPPPEAEPVVSEPPVVSAPTATPMPITLRRFECTKGGARKFWQIGRHGSDVTVVFGRIGTQGQTQLKQFADEARAQREVDKLVAEKLRKGYVER